MRSRSNLIIIFAIAFFLVGGAIVVLVLNDDDDPSGSSGSSETAAAQRLVTVFTATEDIPANTFGADVLSQGLLETTQVPAADVPAGAISSAAILTERIVATPIPAEEIITEASLIQRSLAQVQVPEGFEAAAISIPFVEGGAGYIAPGDRVNLYAQYGPGDDELAGLAGVDVPRTELALTNVLVLDVSRQATTTAAQASQAGSTNVARQAPGGEITYLLALRTADVERVFQISEYARTLRITLVADTATAAGDTGGSDGSNVNGPVSSTSATEPAG